MRSWFRRNADPNATIRDTLFGDMPWPTWAREGQGQEPWVSFARALLAAETRNADEASAILRGISTKRP
jgi:hypothetical protein